MAKLVKITKKQISKLVALRTGVSQRVVGRVVDGLVDVISAEIKVAGQVSVSRLGIFSSRISKAGLFPIPGTGEKIFKPSGLRPVFKASSVLKKFLNGGE